MLHTNVCLTRKLPDEEFQNIHILLTALFLFFPSKILRVFSFLKDIIDKLRFVQNGSGAVPSPFDCYLVRDYHVQFCL